MPFVRLSVLDQSPVRSGATEADAIQEPLELAQAAERLGYHVTITHDPKARLRSYELLAEAFGLERLA